MFGLFSFFRSRSKPAHRKGNFFRPRIDLLEQRDCPAGGPPAGISLTLSTEVLAGHMVRLSGDVTGENASGAQVNFSGAATGYAIADAYGHYSITTSEADLGAVTATAVNSQNEVSNEVITTISAPKPTVEFNLSYNSETSITLNGYVTSVDGVDTDVTLSGVLAAATVHPDANGYFTITVDALSLGEIDAVATDTWSESSDVAAVFVVSDVPTIQDFRAENAFFDIVTVSGRVVDESPGGRTVTFAGMAGLTGQTATTDFSGNFTFTFTRPAGASATISAQVADQWGQSTVVYTFIQGGGGFSEISLNTEVLAGHQVALTGNLVGYTVAGSVVTFSGAVTGSTTADANGYYSYVGSNSSLGDVTVSATNAADETSADVTVAVTKPDPTVTLAVAYASPTSVTLTGEVTSIDGILTTVTLSGPGVIDTIVVYPDEYGYYSVTVSTLGSGEITAVASDTWGTDSYAATVMLYPYVPPISLTLNSEVLPGHLVRLSGYLTGANVAGAQVNFSGAAIGSAIADEYGQFSITTSEADLGVVTATAVNSQNEVSNEAITNIEAPKPTVALSLSYNSETSITLNGYVTSVDGVDTDVTLSGVLAAATVHPDANGYFTITVDALSLGEIDAVATDTWSESSDVAAVFVVSDVPTIQDFRAENAFFDIVTVSGRVVDESPGGRTVTFAGMAGLTGQTATTDFSGNFTFTFTRPAGASATISAQVADQWGQSTVVYTFIQGGGGFSEISLNSEVLAGHQVALTGNLVGYTVAGSVVTFSGAVTGSTTADANGYYSYVGSISSLGDVTVSATNAADETSANVTVAVTKPDPTVTLVVTYNSGTSVTLSGEVTSVDGIDTAVTLSGSGVIDTIVVYPDEYGFYSVTLNALALGDLSAVATDTWGATSYQSLASIYSYVPYIADYQAAYGSNGQVTLTGQVIDESPEGLTVVFSGLDELTGLTANTDANGYFSLTFTMTSESGSAWAQTTDVWELFSSGVYQNLSL